MSKILVKQSKIEIHDYTWNSCRKLENTFAIQKYTNTGGYFVYKGIQYDKDSRILTIPKGVDIQWLENILMTTANFDYSYDEYKPLSDVKIKYLPRDEVQKEAIRFMVGEGEYSVNRAYSSLSVNLNTGKGKTYCSIMAMGFLNIKTIIITYSVDWLHQWDSCIKEYTTLEDKDICFISGSGGINRLFKKGSDHSVYLVTHSTLKSYGDKEGWDKIGELFKFLNIGIKVYDEAHLNFDNMVNIDYNTNTFKTYYVTATPNRSDNQEDRIYQQYMRTVKSIDLFDEDEDPRTAYIAMRYNSNPTAYQISSCRNAFNLDRNRYIEYLVQQDNFYNILHIVLKKAINTPGKILMYIGINESILVVKEWIENNYPSLINNIGIYTSIIKENKKAELNNKIILSTTKSSGAAVDIKDLAMTVVLADPFSSRVIARQTLGRTRDDNTTYIDLIDEGFKQTKQYYTKKQPIFNKYASSCTEIRVTNNIIESKAKEAHDYYNSLIHPVSIRDEDYIITPIRIVTEPIIPIKILPRKS